MTRLGSREAVVVRDAVVILMLRDGGRLLAARRGPAATYTGHWTFPSGRVESGETQADTVTREALEELNMRLSADRKVWECPTDDGLYLLHWWTTHTSEEDPTPDGNEVDEIRWLDADEFLQLEPTFAGDRQFVLEVLPSLLEGS